MIDGDLSDGDNQVKNDMFKYGYKNFQKNTGTKPAPGGAGSAFNEIMSGEGVHTLEKNPDMTEEELARDMYEKTKDTALGKEQKKTTGLFFYVCDVLLRGLRCRCRCRCKPATVFCKTPDLILYQYPLGPLQRQPLIRELHTYI